MNRYLVVHFAIFYIIVLIIISSVRGNWPDVAELDRKSKAKLEEIKAVLQNSEQNLLLAKSRLLQDVSLINKKITEATVYSANLQSNKPKAASQHYDNKAGAKIKSYTPPELNKVLINEINRMTAANIPREAIVDHVRSHYPEKQPHEWTDIVVMASMHGGRLSDTNDHKKAKREEIAFNQLKYERQKAAHEARKKLYDN